MNNYTSNTILSELKKIKNSENIKGMEKYGINPQYVLGISIPTLRKFAKSIGKNHNLAIELWNSKIHEARILATMIDDYKQVTKSQLNKWASEFNSWDLCDQACNNLIRKTTFAIDQPLYWCDKEPEFIRRAGFVLMAVLAVHNKGMTNEEFIRFFPLITKYSFDERNFVKKAVNWALRQIGKRNKTLNTKAIKVCNNLIQMDSKSAKWIGRDALSELTNEKILSRIS